MCRFFFVNLSFYFSISLSLLSCSFLSDSFFFPARIQLQTTNSSNNVVAIFYSSSTNNSSNRKSTNMEKQQQQQQQQRENRVSWQHLCAFPVAIVTGNARAESKRQRDRKRITTQRLRTPSQWLCEWVLSGDMLLAVLVAAAAGVHVALVVVVFVVGTT